jgi:hypothetical protein
MPVSVFYHRLRDLFVAILAAMQKTYGWPVTHLVANRDEAVAPEYSPYSRRSPTKWANRPLAASSRC